MSEYPKAKYRKSELGDIKQQYSMERHPYLSALVKNYEEEEKLGPGWFDRPDLAMAELPISDPQSPRFNGTVGKTVEFDAVNMPEPKKKQAKEE